MSNISINPRTGKDAYHSHLSRHRTSRGFANKGAVLVEVEAKFRGGTPRIETTIVNDRGEVAHTSYLYPGAEPAHRSNLHDADGRVVKADTPGGTVRFTIEKHRLRELEALTMTPDELEAVRSAERSHLASMRQWLRAGNRGSRSTPQLDGNDVSKWDEASKLALGKYAGTVQSELARLGIQLKPFERFEVVRDDGEIVGDLDLELAEKQAAASEDRLARVVAAAVAEAMKGAKK